MKKKISKKKKPTKQKIDVVLESLLNLERRIKELIKEIEQLKNTEHHRYYPPTPQYPQPQYWPNLPYPTNDKSWTYHN